MTDLPADPFFLLDQLWENLPHQGAALPSLLDRTPESRRAMEARLTPDIPIQHAAVLFAALEHLFGVDADAFFEAIGRPRKCTLPEMVQVPAGEFVFQGQWTRISTPFLISLEPVTGAKVSELAPELVPHPERLHLSWFMANLYAGYRDCVLPTAAECAYIAQRHPRPYPVALQPTWCGDGPREPSRATISDPFGPVDGPTRTVWNEAGTSHTSQTAAGQSRVNGLPISARLCTVSPEVRRMPRQKPQVLYTRAPLHLVH